MVSANRSLCGWGDVSVGGGERMVFVFGDRLVAAVFFRCSGLWVRLCHLHDSEHWGVTSCMSLVDVGCRPEDPGVRQAAI